MPQILEGVSRPSGVWATSDSASATSDSRRSSLGHQGLEGLCQSRRCPSLGDDRGGDEGGDGGVAHAIDDLADDVHLGARRLVALRQQFEHHVWRQAAGRLRRVLQDLIEALGIAHQRGLGHETQQADQRTRLRAYPAFLGGILVDPARQLAEPLRIAGDLEQRLHRLGIQIDRITRQAVGDDAVPGGVGARLALPQDLGVVDFSNLEVRAAGGGPQPADPAFGEQILGRAGQQQQERAPGGRVGRTHQPQFADQMVVEQLGKFGDGRVGPYRRAVVDQQAVGQHR